jgi:hypothetical protein
MYTQAVDICIALADEALNANQPVKLISQGELSL